MLQHFTNRLAGGNVILWHLQFNLIILYQLHIKKKNNVRVSLDLEFLMHQCNQTGKRSTGHHALGIEAHVLDLAFDVEFGIYGHNRLFLRPDRVTSCCWISSVWSAANLWAVWIALWNSEVIRYLVTFGRQVQVLALALQLLLWTQVSVSLWFSLCCKGKGSWFV